MGSRERIIVENSGVIVELAETSEGINLVIEEGELNPIQTPQVFPKKKDV